MYFSQKLLTFFPKNEADVVVNALVDELSTTAPCDSLSTNAEEQKDVFSNRMVSDETKCAVYSGE